jgi:hypothetical protein
VHPLDQQSCFCLHLQPCKSIFGQQKFTREANKHGLVTILGLRHQQKMISEAGDAHPMTRRAFARCPCSASASNCLPWQNPHGGKPHILGRCCALFGLLSKANQSGQRLLFSGIWELLFYYRSWVHKAMAGATSSSQAKILLCHGG